MKLGTFLLGILCFFAIVAYWYFLPYQFYLGLIEAGPLWGPVLGNLSMLIITAIVGIPISIVLGILGFILLDSSLRR